MKKLRVGFIGLGLMGKPMAKNILKSGFDLTVYNRTKSRCRELEVLGANVASSPAQVGLNSDVVITMVTGPKDVRQVLLGRGGVVEDCASSPIIVDMSTIGVSAAQELAEDLKVCKVKFVDAPVTGSVTRAETGELVIFVGGEKAVVEKIRPVLEAMGSQVLHMGGVGYGQAMKLVNNLIAGETIVTLAESFILAEKLNLSRKKVASALQNVFGVSPNMKAKMPNIVRGQYPTAFSMANIDKDLKLALLELPEASTLPLLKKSEQLFAKGIKEGYGSEDLSAVVKVLEVSS